MPCWHHTKSIRIQTVINGSYHICITSTTNIKKWGHNRRHPVAGPQWQTPFVEVHCGDAARRQADSASHVWPRRWVIFEDASSESSTETTLKSTDWSWPVEGDDSPPPCGDFSETTETVDLTQSIEGDDCLPLSGDSNETGLVTTCQRGTEPPTLDPHVWEFLSRTGSPGSGGDQSDQCLMPEPSFDDPQEWVRWCTHQVDTLVWSPELLKVPTPKKPP